jgi:hypothetical protein
MCGPAIDRNASVAGPRWNRTHRAQRPRAAGHIPVRLVLSNDTIMLRVAVDSTLDRAARGAVVTFEADETGADGQRSAALTGWLGRSSRRAT